MARKKPEGLQAIVAKQDPVSIQDLTMQDFFAAFALQGLLSHYGGGDNMLEDIYEEAINHAKEMLQRRAT